MRLRTLTIAAPLAALFLALAALCTAYHTTPTGLPVRIARLGSCGDVRTVVLEVSPHGGLRLNSEALPQESLARRLKEIFRTRAYRYVFVIGDPAASFAEVAEVIDIATTQVDHVTLAIPSVVRQATYRGDGTCLDPNLPKEYILNPRR